MLQLVVTHRFRDPVNGSTWHAFYSLDSGADWGFGFTYTPLANTEIAVYRSGLQSDIEFSAKYAFHPGGENSVFGAAIRMGGDDRLDPVVVVENDGSLLADSQAR